MWQLYLWNSESRDYTKVGEAASYSTIYRKWEKMQNGGKRQRLRRYAVGRA
jgi:hypothetical protein